MRSAQKEADDELKRLSTKLESEKEKTLDTKRRAHLVAEEHQGLQEELSVATAKMKGLEEELIGTRQQVAEAQESQERRMLEFQQATAMLKEHSQKFKQQEARKAQQMVEAVRREEKEKMSHLEAELEQSGHEVKRLETEVIKMSDEMTRAMKCVEEQKERDQKEKEVVRERLLELRVQTKGLKVGLAEARRVQEEQLKRLQLLGEEAAEAAGLKQRVLSLESCQHTMGECLKEYQERAREAKEEEQHAKDQVRRLAETLVLERRSRN